MKSDESKEGGEMGASFDTKVEEAATVPPVLSSVPPVPTPVLEKFPSPVPIVNREISSTIPQPGPSFYNFSRNVSPSETLSVSLRSLEIKDKENNTEKIQSKIVLKYKEDQWSPLNPEGKKQYGRDFLLQLQFQPFTLCKPTNLKSNSALKEEVTKFRDDIAKNKEKRKKRNSCTSCQINCGSKKGLKSHNASESHQSCLISSKMFVNDPHKYVEELPPEFLEDFADFLRRLYGYKTVDASQVYKKYISYRKLFYLKATHWDTLRDFVQRLGQEGYCTVDEKGRLFFISYKDRAWDT